MQAATQATPQTASDPAWQAVSAFVFDDPAASLCFSRRLQREQFGWSREFTLRAINEYRRFFYLMATSDSEITPSEVVDQVWHLHLVYTRGYQELCAAAESGFIHHGPTRGGRSEGVRFVDQYEATLARYREVFGEPPPADIWPATAERFANAGAGRWVDASEHLIVPRSRLLAAGLVCLALSAAIFTAIWLVSSSG